MKVRYEHGGEHDPIKQILANQLAADRADLGFSASPSMQLYGFEDGPVNMRPDLLLDVLGGPATVKAGVQGIRQLMKKSPELYKKLMGSGTKVVDDAAKQGGFDPTDIAALRKDGVSEEEIMKLVKGPQTKMTKKTADNTQAYIERMKKQKVQNQANRALREAARDESQQFINMQRRLSELGMEAAEAEKIAQKIFKENVDDIFTQARIDDMVLGKGDQLAKQLGPTMQELYKTNRGVFDAIYNELIQPVTSKKISGAVNPRMNQFGGKINVRKA
tara:strand:- start:313 stop:1137 length:825 start_codon:yes stop_codon:yes gene_type:complete